MIDFRYHLVSITAVLLALAIGIVTGSGFLGGPLLRRLEKEVRSVRETNAERRAEVDELARRLDSSEAALLAVEPSLVDGALRAQRIVLFEFAGTDGGLIDSVRQAVEQADGEIASTVTLSEGLVLDDPDARGELGAAVGSAASAADSLRVRVGAMIGARAGAAARGVLTGRRRLNRLLARLGQGGYVSVDAADQQQPVPLGSAFLVVGGGTQPAPFQVHGLAKSLATALARRQQAVMVAESQQSVWGLTSAIRDDGAAAAIVWTDDQADTPAGRIALALGLARADDGAARHFGTGPGATDLMPELTSTG